jgi:hypothetical protein
MDGEREAVPGATSRPSAGTRSSRTLFTLGTDELPNTLIHGDQWPSGDKGEAQRAMGDLVPYDPSYKRPMRVGWP